MTLRRTWKLRTRARGASYFYCYFLYCGGVVGAGLRDRKVGEDAAIVRARGVRGRPVAVM